MARRPDGPGGPADVPDKRPKGGAASKPKSSKAPATKAAASKAADKPPRKPAAAKAPRRSSKRPPSRPPGMLTAAWWRAEAVTWVLGLVAGGVLASGMLWLDARRQVAAYLAAPPHSTPSTVWSAPIRIRVGETYPLADLSSDLLAAGYERAGAADAPGRFAVAGDQVTIWTEALTGAGVDVPRARGTLRLEEDRVVATEPPAGLLLRPTLLATLGDLEARRTPVTLATVSPWMAPALLAIEDTRFHDHSGVDPLGILRALVHNLRGQDLHGGSTLTQQLAKNLFLHQDRTLRRKVREVFFAAALEAELDKDELLELYLSEVYLGHVNGVPVHGVEQAARSWFGKPASRLTVGEAATIAGTIASPNAWSPLRDIEAALARRDQVIRRMVYVRALTQAQADAALAEPLATVATPPSLRWQAPWIVDAALDAAAERLGEGFTAGAGYHITTTAQPHLQRSAQRAVTDGLLAMVQAHPDEPGLADAEAALVAVDADTGDVVALVGGRDFIASPFNRATRARRQAGSTVKPLVLLAALQADASLSPATLFDDAPLSRTFDGQTWRPANSDGQFKGPVTLRLAIEQSRNVPAVLLSERVGLPAVRRALADAGLTEATTLPSVALGAFPSTPLQVAGAYTAFPGAGTGHVPRVLLGIDSARGEALVTTTSSPRPLADRTAAVLATRILQGVLTDGTARSSGAMGIHGPFGGKTGTTDKARDAWFAGFDPDLVAAVWVGRDRAELGLAGATAALPVWARFMTATGAPRGRLPTSDAVVEATVCRSTGLPPCDDCTGTRTEWFRADHVPDAPCLARVQP